MKLHRFTSGKAWLLAGVALLSSPWAQADLLNPVAVSLLAPGGVTDGTNNYPALVLSETAPLATGIQSGGTGDIGSYMLDKERIAFSGNSILVHLAAGAESAGGQFSTGYLGLGGVHARYVFDNLAIAGKTIIGFQAYDFDGYGTSGNTGLLGTATANSYVHLLSATSLSLDLDTQLFKSRTLDANTPYNFAEFRIDLITQDAGNTGGNNNVPEPGSLALVGLSLAGLAWRRRRPTAGADAC